MDIGSGSDEVVEVSLSEMRRRDRFFLHPTFELGDRTWEVASIGPAGTEIRLRPTVAEEQEAIGVGTDVPDWEATTLPGQQISASSLEGKYLGELVRAVCGGPSKAEGGVRPICGSKLRDRRICRSG
jgi:hypothetical protein